MSRRRRKRKPQDSAALSRAGLQRQRAVLQGLVRESVDMALERSRTTLIRQLTVSLADNATDHGQPIAPDALCHAPACARNYLTDQK